MKELIANPVSPKNWAPHVDQALDRQLAGLSDAKVVGRKHSQENRAEREAWSRAIFEGWNLRSVIFQAEDQ